MKTTTIINALQIAVLIFAGTAIIATIVEKLYINNPQTMQYDEVYTDVMSAMNTLYAAMLVLLTFAAIKILRYLESISLVGMEERYKNAVDQVNNYMKNVEGKMRVKEIELDALRKQVEMEKADFEFFKEAAAKARKEFDEAEKLQKA